MTTKRITNSLVPDLLWVISIALAVSSMVPFATFRLAFVAVFTIFAKAFVPAVEDLDLMTITILAFLSYVLAARAVIGLFVWASIPKKLRQELIK